MGVIDVSAAHYRKLEPIGAGGMGVVWKAEDTKLGRIVALKFLAPELTRDADSKIRFLREARSASLLEHPNICTIYEVGEGAEGETFIAMPYYEGKTLKELIASGPLAIDEALAIGAQIARGLAKAHGSGIIHRDIKPANLFVTNDGVAKILDFGLAKLTDATSITRPNTALGTLPYMAPELLAGAEAGPAADIWSLGLVLFEMLSGRHPFSGGRDVALAAAILHSEPPSLEMLRPEIRAEVAALVASMLKKDAEQRFGPATEVATSLENLRRKMAVQAAPSDSRTATFVLDGRSTLRARLRRGAIGSVAIFAIIVAATTWFAMRGRERQAEPGARTVARAIPRVQRIAVLPIVNSDKESEHISDGITRHLIDELSMSSSLRVTAPVSAFRYKDAKSDPITIGRELGVSTVITGSVAKEGSSSHLRLEMTDTRDGAQIWAQDFVAPAGDLANLRRRVVSAASLRLGITSADRGSQTSSPEAYDLYLRGRFLWSVRTRENLLRAIGLFEEAIALDPNFALAWSGLGNAYGALSGNRLMPGSEAEILRKSEEAIDKALELDPTIAEAWTSRAASKHSFHEFEEADRLFNKAIVLNPSYASAHQWYSSLLRATGRKAAARREIDFAFQLDPFSGAVNMFACWDRMLSREYDAAIDHARRARASDPRLTLGPCVSWCFILKGDYEAAIDARQGTVREQLASAWKKEGRDGFWRVLIEQFEDEPYNRATVFSMMGNPASAFADLDRAYATHDSNLNWMYVDPRLDSLRSDPRFDAMARKIGFPQVEERGVAPR